MYWWEETERQETKTIKKLNKTVACAVTALRKHLSPEELAIVFKNPDLNTWVLDQEREKQEAIKKQNALRKRRETEKAKAAAKAEAKAEVLKKLSEEQIVALGLSKLLKGTNNG